MLTDLRRRIAQIDDHDLIRVEAEADTNELGLTLYTKVLEHSNAMTSGIGASAANQVLKAISVAKRSWQERFTHTDLVFRTQLIETNTREGERTTVQAHLFPINRMLIPAMTIIANLKIMYVSHETKTNRLGCAIEFRIQEDGYAMTAGIGEGAANQVMKAISVVRYYFQKNSDGQSDIVCMARMDSEIFTQGKLSVTRVLFIPIPSILIPPLPTKFTPTP